MPRRLGRTARLLLCLSGAVIIAGGQYTIAKVESVDFSLDNSLCRLSDHLFVFLPKFFPPGVALGLTVILLGALLIAVATAALTADASVTGDAVAAIGDGRWSGTRALLLLACVLATFSTVCAAKTSLHPAAVGVWVATCLCGCIAMLMADKARQTRIGNPLSGWEGTVILLLMVADTWLVAHDLTHWGWAGIPDESNFFQVAKSIATNHSQRFLLSEHGVFEYHPVLSSFYQSVFMKVLGVNVFAWRLSSVFALAVSLPFLYVLMRELWSRAAGWAAVVFFGSTQLAVGFAHLGYNNVQVYPVVLGALALFAWAKRRGSVLGYYLAGCVAGLGFYTFQPAMLAPLLVVLLGVALGALPLRAGDRFLTLGFALGVVFVILPACTHFPDTIAHIVQQTAIAPQGSEVHVSQLGNSVGSYLGSGANAFRVLEHWIWSLVYPFWFNRPHHFQTNPIVDPVCSGLAAVGWCICILTMRRRRSARFLLAVYVLSALLVGATSQHDRPPLTRLLFLSPFAAMLAAVGVDQFVRGVDVTSRRSKAAWALGISLVTASAVWSITQLHVAVHHTFHGYGDGTTSEILRIARTLPADTHLVYVQQEPTGMPCVDMILEEYGLQERFTYLHSAKPDESGIVEALSQLSPPFIVFTNLVRPEELATVEHTIAAHFPDARWYDSAPQQPSSVRYAYIAQATDLAPDTAKK